MIRNRLDTRRQCFLLSVSLRCAEIRLFRETQTHNSGKSPRERTEYRSFRKFFKNNTLPIFPENKRYPECGNKDKAQLKSKGQHHYKTGE